MNSCMINQTDLQDSTPSGLLVFKATGITVAILSSILGESLCLLVIRGSPNIIEPVTRILVTSAAISDIFAAIFVFIPILGATIADRWPYGEQFCGIHWWLMAHLLVCCATSLVFVNTERYIAITRPYDYHSLITPYRARLVVILTWTGTGVLSTVVCFFPGSTIRYSELLHACLIDHVNPCKPDVVGIVFYILFIFVPCSAILTMYIRFYVIARKHARQIGATPRRNPEDGNKEQANISTCSNMKAFTTYSLVTLTICFVIIPPSILYIYKKSTQQDPPKGIVFIAEIIAMTFGTWNLLIHYTRNENFREAAKRLIKKYLSLNLFHRESRDMPRTI